tara:strand:+ start:16125 stop:16961 length:837 start_codon:yes stop_codon:yes gene_type:complete
MNKLYTKIVNEFVKYGILKTNVYEIFNEEQLKYFYEVQQLYEDVLQYPRIQDRIKRINSGNPNRDRTKWYEITQYEFFLRGLSPSDSLVKLYLQQPFLDIAKMFYGELPKMRNVLMWAHPKNGIPQSIASQNWHRDQEDYKILKVFINFSEINNKNGPTEFCIETQHGGKYDYVYPQYFLDKKANPSNFNPSKSDLEIVDISGPIGTVSFINANGVHRGGLVKEGIRLLTHCNYIIPSAPLIKNGTLGRFDYNHEINTVNFEDESFTCLTQEQKYLLI